jgi:hypothetical protein
MPEEGWVRTHHAFRGKGINGNALVENLGSDPVRVPVLLNRTITFQKPGLYEVTVETERLRPSKTFSEMTTLERCDPCRTTNAIYITIAERDESEEAALVVSLSHELENTKGDDLESVMSENKDQREALARELGAQLDAAIKGEPDQKQLEAVMQKMNDFMTAQLALVEKRKDARLGAAVRLAYLGGDDATRAKVHFIVADEEKGDGTSIGLIMVDGLPSSRNKELQLTLLQTAWRDPQHVPTSVLQSALRQAKELVHKGVVTEESILWGGTAEERQAALEESKGEIDEIVATLPQRTEPNRAATINFLKKLGVPNQFNQRPQ